MPLYSATATRNFRGVEQFVFGGLLFLVALTWSRTTGSQFTLPKLLALSACLPLVAIYWALRLNRGDIGIPPRVVLIPTAALGVWWVLSSILAEVPFIAWHGAYGRYNGALTSLACLFVFLALSSIRSDLRDVEALVRMLVGSLIPVCVIAVGQSAGWLSSGYSGDAQIAGDLVVQARAASTIGHPVPLGAVIDLALPFTLALIVESRGLTRVRWTCAFGLLAVTLLATQSRGPWIGAAAGLAIVVVEAVRGGRVPRRVVIHSAVVCASLTILAVAVLPALRVRVVARVASLLHLERDASTLNRFVFYQSAWSMAVDHPILGVGLENFGVAYPRYRPPQSSSMPSDVVPTMVHNGYLQLASTTGVPGLALYALLIGLVLVRLWGVRRAPDGRRQILARACVGAIVSFLIQDLSGWPELSLSVYFWTVVGLAMRLSAEENSKPSVGLTRIGYGLAALTATVACLWAVQVGNELSADRLVFRARSLDPRNDWAAMDRMISRAVNLTGANAHYYDTAGTLYVSRLFVSSDASAYAKGVQLLDDAHRMNRLDPYIVVHRLDLERCALNARVVAAPSADAERYAQALPAMDPNNASIFAALAAFRLAEGQTGAAADAFERLRILKPVLGRYVTLQNDINAALGRIQ